MKTTEKQLLGNALQAFHETTALPAEVIKTALPLGGMAADAQIRLGKMDFLVEVKGALTAANLGPLAAELKRLPQPAVLVTRHVGAPMAERLKEMGVPFIDEAGNAFVRDGDMLIYVTGRKPKDTRVERPARVFRATGLRVVFALLCQPELVGTPYRTIAQKAGVALGSVTHVIKGLEALGFVRAAKTGRALQQRTRLIDVWVDAYPRELRPRLRPRRFRVETIDWWKTEDFGRLGMWLGGEPAAALLTKYLRPEIVTLYGDTGFEDLARRIRPAKDERGNLEILMPFWQFEPEQPVRGRHLVPPLLVYADLLATADERNLETAEMIRERYLG